MTRFTFSLRYLGLVHGVWSETLLVTPHVYIMFMWTPSVRVLTGMSPSISYMMLILPHEFSIASENYSELQQSFVTIYFGDEDNDIL